MTTWFVTRHPGAVEWAARQGLAVDRPVAHLDINEVKPGDTVIGILPVHLAAEVCARGARFYNLSLDVPPEARGRELDADALERFGARLEAFEVRKTTKTPTMQPLLDFIHDVLDPIWIGVGLVIAIPVFLDLVAARLRRTTASKRWLAATKTATPAFSFYRSPSPGCRPHWIEDSRYLNMTFLAELMGDALRMDASSDRNQPTPRPVFTHDSTQTTLGTTRLHRR